MNIGNISSKMILSSDIESQLLQFSTFGTSWARNGNDNLKNADEPPSCLFQYYCVKMCFLLFVASLVPNSYASSAFLILML